MQCLHQHTPLWEVLDYIRCRNIQLAPRLLRYKAHVCRQTYVDTTGLEQRLLAKEDVWFEYKYTASLLLFPQYMSRTSATDVNACGNAASTEVASNQQQTSSHHDVATSTLAEVEEEGRVWQDEHQMHVQKTFKSTSFTTYTSWTKQPVSGCL